MAEVDWCPLCHLSSPDCKCGEQVREAVREYLTDVDPGDESTPLPDPGYGWEV